MLRAKTMDSRTLSSVLMFSDQKIVDGMKARLASTNVLYATR